MSCIFICFYAGNKTDADYSLASTKLRSVCDYISKSQEENSVALDICKMRISCGHVDSGRSWCMRREMVMLL